MAQHTMARNVFDHINWKGNALVLTFLGYLFTANAQHLEFEWSEKMRYSNQKNGFFSDFINTNENNLYVLQTNKEVTQPYKNAKVRLVAYNKYSMVLIHSVALKGFSENRAQKELYQALDYLKTEVFNDKIYVFWRKLINTDSTRTEELYVQTFKPDLEVDQSLSKVFTSVQEVDIQASFFSPSKFVILSDKTQNRLYIGTEKCRSNQVSFEYCSLQPSLSVGELKQTILPQPVDSLTQNLSAHYELGNDGIIYIRSMLRNTAEEQEQMLSKEGKTYLVVSALVPETANRQQYILKSARKTITDFSCASGKEKSRILGFFGDLEKDSTGIDKQGVFYLDYDLVNHTFSELQFTYFEKTTLNRLFPRSKGGRRKNIEQPSPEELEQTRFDIERLVPMVDGSYILFFTRKYNYTETTAYSGMDGRNRYVQTQYCEKNNVSAIRFTAAGKVQWTSNIERNKTYRGTNVSDLRVITRFDKIFVVFGNDLLAKGRKKKAVSEEDQWTSELSYAIFDPVTGRGKMYTTPVNEEKTKKSDLKYIQPNSAVVFDEQLYFQKMTVKQHPLWIAANIVFFPSLYYTFNTANTKIGKGDLTVGTIFEGKRKRK